MDLKQCLVCNKQYKSEKMYENHKWNCIDPDKLLDSENVSMREILVVLLRQNRKQQQQIDELKKWVQNKKRKINIIDYLNNNVNLDKLAPNKQSNNYSSFVSSIEIGIKELELIFKSNIIDGIIEIFELHIKRYSENNKIPICGYSEKDNIIYKYNNQKWEILSQNSFNEDLSVIYKKIMKEFKNWQDLNEEGLYNSSDFSEMYIKNVKKIMGGDIPIEKQRTKIYRNLYKVIKKDFKQALEYELE